MQTQNKKLIRQGDVLFIPVGTLPKGAEPIEGTTIQAGEVTGHHHRLAPDALATLFVLAGQAWPQREQTMFVQTKEREEPLFHEDHGAPRDLATKLPQPLAPRMVYRVQIAREFDYSVQFARRVRD